MRPNQHPALFWAVAVLCAAIPSMTHLSRAADPVKPVRVTIEFSTYRGYWRIDDAGGREVAHDECFTQKFCREVLKSIGAGDYTLVLSKEPQSMPLKFRVSQSEISVTSGKEFLAASGMTLRLSGLKRAAFNLDGYRGNWSLANWDGAEATGFFRRDGGAQVIELVPNTTYGFKLGPVVVERFQIDNNERIVLIDSTGALKPVAGAANTVRLSTLPVAIFPETITSDPASWTLAGLPPPDGRPAYKGPVILRLAQGATYRLLVVGAGPQEKPYEFFTGNGCNMNSQTINSNAGPIHLTPIPAACRN